MRKTQIMKVDHPLYSPDLATRDFWHCLAQGKNCEGDNSDQFVNI